jgi:glycosyltransferase involved in cell wall biosynthesis
MTERRRLVVVGPLPPPHHGVTVSTSLVLASAELRRRFRVEHFDTSDHRPVRNVGRWDLRNVGAALGAVARFAARLRGERGLVYLPISQGLPGLARDTLLIRLAAARGWRVSAHLRGSELGDVYRHQPALVRAWLRPAFERLDSVAVLGESVRGALDGILPRERIAVVPNGTPDPGVTSEPAHARMGLFLSNLARRKGPVEAMQAALLVLREDPAVRFVFAGEARDEAVMEELDWLRAHANGRIELRPALTDNEKRELLANAAFLLFPPVEPEGHPRVVLEALAAGVPVITTDRGTIAETVPDGVSGYVLPDPDPAKLAERMLRLLRDDRHRASMASQARARYLDRFTQEAADRALAQWLSRVANDRPNASGR